MSTVHVQPLGPERYGVEVREGDVRTTYDVVVHTSLLDDLGLLEVDPVEVVEQSFAFLLEREPASAILRDFPLETIAHYFPEYYDELRARLAR